MLETNHSACPRMTGCDVGLRGLPFDPKAPFGFCESTMFFGDSTAIAMSADITRSSTAKRDASDGAPSGDADQIIARIAATTLSRMSPDKSRLIIRNPLSITPIDAMANPCRRPPTRVCCCNARSTVSNIAANVQSVDCRIAATNIDLHRRNVDSIRRWSSSAD